MVPKWSSMILSEVHRNQVKKLGWPIDLANHWRTEVERSFPEAMVTRFEALISECKNHEKDQHVLASAIVCQADAIVTLNVKDFPAHALEDWAVDVKTPSQLLISFYEMRPTWIVGKLDDMAGCLGRTRLSTLARLNQTVPSFVSVVAQDLSIDLASILDADKSA